MNTPAVTKAAVSRALKAAASLGHPIAGIRLRPDRSVEVLFGEPLTAAAQAPPSDDLDAELEAFSARHGYS